MAINKEVDFFEKITFEVKETFLKIQDTLKCREIQLLRQIEVLAQHYKLTESYDKCIKEVILNLDTKNDIINSIANFGRIHFNGFPYENEICKIEDYQKPEIDHVSLYKYLERTSSEHSNIMHNAKIDNKLSLLAHDNVVEDITMDKICTDIDKNGCEVPKSILECIEKDNPKLCLHVTNSVESESENNIELNNEENVSLSKSGMKFVFNCDNSKIETTNFNSQCECNACIPNINCNCISIANTSLIMQNNSKQCKINANDNNINMNNQVVIYQLSKVSLKQPVQVQQWMKQIISETEIEPTSNNVMEHSHIENFQKEKTE